MSSFIAIHSVLIVSGVTLVMFVFYRNYYSLYQLRFEQCGDSKNETVSIINTMYYTCYYWCIFFILCSKVFNKTDEYHTDLSPSIKIPILFLFVNFFFMYKIFIILSCLYGLYGISDTRVRCSDGRCSRESQEIEMKETNYDDHGNVTPTKLQIADDDESTSATSDSDAHAAFCARKVSNTSSSWEGDWNKYWNNKSDYWTYFVFNCRKYSCFICVVNLYIGSIL